jgi:DNA polymerase III alpha subunit
METTAAASLNTELADRVLWYDGDSTVTIDTLMRAIMNGKSTEGLFVSELTPEIEQYNVNVLKPERIGVKEDIKPLSFDWNIPEEYKTLDVCRHVATKLMKEIKTDDPELFPRAERVADELNLYQELGLMDVLRTLIFVINTLIENNVVWGVGRGSSVASYVLYLIGVHDVDSFKYGLNIEEFLRTE